MTRARWGGALAAILTAAAALQSAALRSPFFADDWLFLDATRGRGLFAALAAPDPIGNFARPLGRQVWFWLMDRVGGGEPVAFHAANLLLWLLALGMFASLARRLVGSRAALVAVAFLALTHAADVPVGWAAGSQDLLAITFALGSLLAMESGAGILAGMLLLAGLFAKETIVGLPLIALVLTHRSREPWRVTLRRVAPLALAVVVWGAVISRLATGRSLQSGALADPVSGAGATVLAFGRTLLGAESPGAPGLAWAEPLALGAIALAALVVLFARESPPPRESQQRPTLAAGLLWVLVGVAPVALVAPIWSAYYFLFALFGAALVLALLLERAPRGVAALVVGVLGLGAQHARALPVFAPEPNPWASASHVNRAYLEQGGAQVSHLLAEMHRLHPALPKRTTVFFAGLPAWVSFQVADGPLLRVAYRDTSLRSYYLVDFTRERAERGPWRMIRHDAATGRLLDESAEPQLLGSMAMSMLLRDHEDVVDGALALAAARGELSASVRYLGAWRRWERGERDTAVQLLHADGFAHAPGAEALVSQALEALAAGDTMQCLALLQRGRRDHVLDAGVHGVLADLWLGSLATRGNGVLEAYAARVLAPEFPFGWRRWATVQLAYGHRAEAARSLEHYFALAPQAAQEDAEANAVRAELQRVAAPKAH